MVGSKVRSVEPALHPPSFCSQFFQSICVWSAVTFYGRDQDCFHTDDLLCPTILTAAGLFGAPIQLCPPPILLLHFHLLCSNASRTCSDSLFLETSQSKHGRSHVDRKAQISKSPHPHSVPFFYSSPHLHHLSLATRGIAPPHNILL